MIKIYKTKDLTKITLLIALLCISSYIVIPLPFSLTSITAQTVVINIVGFTLKPREAFTTILIYIFIGFIGIPVFAGGTAGPSVIFGPSGGYFLGFLLAVVLISLLRGSKFNMKRYLLVAILVGMPVIYLIGSIYMYFITGISIKNIFITAILPFIPLDILKCVLAVTLVKSLKKVI